MSNNSQKTLRKLMTENNNVIFTVFGAPSYISRYTKSKNSILLEWTDDNSNYDSEELDMDEPLPYNVKAYAVTEL